ncbi:MAG: GxxExxY protein [Flavobacterium sp.]|nr:GxxExxY protein [Flavobacterium sp.]
MELYKKEEYYKIAGICMGIHNILGPGLSEVIYKDALEFEFKSNGIPFEREKAFSVNYKNVILAHQYYADFIVYDEIILEVKAIKEILNEHISQTINYIRLAGSEIGIIVNFTKSLQHKRIII